MADETLSPRLRRLPETWLFGREVRVADSRRARLLGLAGLRRERVGPGLLIPRCRSVHTFGMRFAIDVLFLDRAGEVVEARLAVGSRTVLRCRRAAAVVELPAGDELSLVAC
jgi:uncharacterized membrane protein (UPF0127 family)